MRALRPPSVPLGLAVAVLGCAAATEPSHPTPTRVTPAASASAEAATSATPMGRVPLGDGDVVSVDFVVEPALAGRSALLVSDTAGERAAFVRWIDGRTGRIGPVVRLVDRHVVGGLEGAPGRWTLVTSLAAGDRICVDDLASDGAAPDAGGCAIAAPGAVVRAGDRIAFVEAAVEKPPDPPEPKPSSPAPKAEPRPPRRPARPSDKHRVQHERLRKSAAKKPAPRKAKPKGELQVRFATPAGVFDPPIATGVKMARPLEGMALADAAGRADGGVDLLWYDFDKKRPGGPLGSARLMVGSLGPDGALVRSSVSAIVDDDLEWGRVKDHERPRLVATAAGTIALWMNNGACFAARVAPFVPIPVNAVACAIDPSRIGAREGLPAAEIAALELVQHDEPRRAVGQRAGDPPLVAWAGDRAYYQHDGALRSAGKDGAPREEPAPFGAKRARIAWSAFAPDGEGIAFASGKLWRLPARGPVSEMTGAVPSAAGADEATDRRRAARIAGGWWLARGDVVRLGGEPLGVEALRGRAGPDTSALVGGAERGLFLDLVGAQLRLTAFEASGEPADPIAWPSPVRAGFDAVERRAGGAILAGVSAAAPREVVAVAVDARGALGKPWPTGLPITEGELAVRLSALPRGGALLRHGSHVVWLDDDGRPLASADLGAAASATCVDGRAAPVAWPAPAPGEVARDLGATCVVGDPAWATDGTLRWFESRPEGLDAHAEVVVAARAASPGGARVGEPSPLPAPAAEAIATDVACPSDMVSIHGAFCVDRFEDALVDARTGQPMSPDYPPSATLLEIALGEWATGRERAGDLHGRAFPMPLLPRWERKAKLEPVAVSRLGARPAGYVSGNLASEACERAGKRLCSLDEFTVACRGEDDTLFPYGDDWQDGVCNVFRDEHPAAMLHGNASLGHLDPRLNRVTPRGEPLFRAAGATPACRSRWGADAVYDLVGNVDEWIDDPGGAFAGGFYARSTRSGCDALITAHPRSYFDYSTGVRCCRDPLTAVDPYAE